MSKKKNLDHIWFFLSNFCSFLIELCAILAQLQSTLGLYLVHIFTQIRQKTSHFKLNVKNQIKNDKINHSKDQIISNQELYYSPFIFKTTCQQILKQSPLSFPAGLYL